MNGPPCWPASAHIVETRRKGRIQAVSGSELSSGAKTKNGRVSQEKGDVLLSWKVSTRVIFFFHLQCVLYCPNIFAVIGAKNNRSRGKKSCPGVLTWSWDDLGGKKKEKKAAEPTAKLLIAPLSEPGELFPPLLYFLHFICSRSLVCTQLLQAVSKVCCLMA